MKVRKNMNNVEIAELLEDVAAAYQVKGDKSGFRVVAYQRAADAVEHLSSEAKDLWDEGKLEDVSGIGKSIAGHLGEIFKTGKSKHFDKLMSDLPTGMFEIIKVSGIGPKTAYKISKDLGVKNLNDLEKVARDGKIAELDGFGEDSQAEILKSIKEIKGRSKRILLPYADHLAGEVIEWLKKSKYVVKADPLGSLRRKASTVGDIDLSVSSNEPEKTIDHFCKYPNTSRVLEKGDSSASILLPGNKQIDLKVVSPDEYGALLQHFTGSKHHNIALRELALKRGLSLSEYGIRKVKSQSSKVKGTTKKPKLNKYKTEEEFYKALGMKWIPPEIREDVGEIEAAQDNKLPKLFEYADVKADLQIHSNYDIETSHDLGASSMKDIVNRAGELGYEYIAFTEHNPSKSKHNNKQILEILKKKNKAVEQLNYSYIGRRKKRVKKVYNSLEIDLLPEGSLPVSDDGLETLDFALVSIHSSFRQSRMKMTERVLSGLEHPKVKIFAHPTARKLNEREGIELNWEKVLQYCLVKDKWVEINADPARLDLPDFLIREAVKVGVKLTLGTDAHHVDHMDNMKYGVWNARRGWAEKADIINTRTQAEFDNLIT